jgi:hypothetical protein
MQGKTKKVNKHSKIILLSCRTSVKPPERRPDMSTDKRAQKPGYHLIFRWWFRNRFTGKIVRAKHRPFPFWVKD